MAQVTLKGNPAHTNGELPKIGSEAPDFKLTDAHLKDHSLKDYQGKRKLLSVVPSLETPTCSTSAKKFNEKAAALKNTALLVISADLPFAQSRFCEIENIKNLTTLSMLRSKDFAKDYGILLVDGPIAGLASRAIIILDENNKVIYTELVAEVSHEPNYDAALKALSN